eukprot:2627648-Rhodomonas_salina.1
MAVGALFQTEHKVAEVSVHSVCTRWYCCVHALVLLCAYDSTAAAHPRCTQCGAGTGRALPD